MGLPLATVGMLVLGKTISVAFLTDTICGEKQKHKLLLHNNIHRRKKIKSKRTWYCRCLQSKAKIKFHMIVVLSFGVTSLESQCRDLRRCT